MSEVPALQRGIDIINYIRDNDMVSLQSLEDGLGIPKASLSRLVKCLITNGYVRQDMKNRTLILGEQLYYTAMSAYEKDTITLLAQPIIDSLVSEWEVTFVIYELLSPFNVIWRVKREAPGGIKTQPIGFSIDHMNRNAQGLQFLSELDDAQIEDYLNNGTIYPATTHSLTDKEAIRERIKEIRSKGFSYQERENSLSMKQIAVPLEIASLPNKLCLGCYLPINFDKVEKLTEQMLIASSTLSRTT